MNAHIKAVALPLKIKDYITGYQEIMTLVDSSYSLHARIESKGAEYGFHIPIEAQPRGSVEDTKQKLLARFWNVAFQETGFMRFMDSQAVDQFHTDLERCPPEFTMANVETTFLSLASEAETLFRRGLWNLFNRLSSEYRTNPNTPFEIGEKVVLRGFISNWCGRTCEHNRWKEWNDLDRIFTVLDGQEFTPHRLTSAIDAALKGEQTTYDDHYFHVKTFLNGNAHVKFKRLDLVEKANEQVVLYCRYNIEKDRG